MNKKNVLLCTGGGGEPLNRVHYGGNPVIPNNNRRSCRDNAAVAHRQY